SHDALAERLVADRSRLDRADRRLDPGGGEVRRRLSRKGQGGHDLGTAIRHVVGLLGPSQIGVIALDAGCHQLHRDLGKCDAFLVRARGALPNDRLRLSIHGNLRWLVDKETTIISFLVNLCDMVARCRFPVDSPWSRLVMLWAAMRQGESCRSRTVSRD